MRYGRAVQARSGRRRLPSGCAARLTAYPIMVLAAVERVRHVRCATDRVHDRAGAGKRLGYLASLREGSCRRAGEDRQTEP